MTDIIPATTQTTPEKRQLALLRAVGLDKAAPEQRELALAIADRYGLDLMLKHLVLVEGRPYLTRDALLHIAHRSGQLDGIETSEPVLDGDFWRAVCSVYRKDMSRPFTYHGRYPAKGGNARFAPEMALKVAESMSLRRAFDISAPSADERWDAPEPAVPQAPAKVTLAEFARARAQSPEPVQEPHEDAEYAEVAPEPEVTAAPAPDGVCGHVAQDGLMAGSVCDLRAGHKSAHKQGDTGSWPL